MTTPTDTDYRDRMTGLVIFGIFEILIGGFCALAIPLVMLSRAFAPATRAGLPSGAPSLFPMVAIYAIAAVSFIWLGIGSILARRWARAILLSFSGIALCGGVIGCVTVGFMLPHILSTVAQNSRQELPPATLLIMKVVMVGTLLVVYIVIPAALFLFYRSPNVKRTCEARDPVERWTDRCPPPVLACSLLMGFAAVIFLTLTRDPHGVPIFGAIASGTPGRIILVLIAALLLYVARGLFRLQIRAWWVALAMVVLSGISSVVTFWEGSIRDIYTRMGYNHETSAVAGQFFDGASFKWKILLSMLPWLIWLICIRRYFKPPALPPVLPEGTPTSET
jgi:hypothetical protein